MHANQKQATIHDHQTTTTTTTRARNGILALPPTQTILVIAQPTRTPPQYFLEGESQSLLRLSQLLGSHVNMKTEGFQYIFLIIT